MSRTSQRTPGLPFPYGRPLSEVSSRAYRSSRKTMVHRQGYVLQHAPDHPKANRYGYVMKHRLVAERVLGRILLPGEVVHHEDRDPRNNCPSNLWLFPSQAEHMRHHKREALCHQPALAEKLRPLAANPRVTMPQAARRLRCSVATVQQLLKQWGIRWVSAALAPLDEASVRAALQGRSTLEAARALGVNHQTIRNRFPSLVVKRASPGFLEAHREEIRSRATRERTEALCERFGCHQTALTRAIHRWAREEPGAWKDVLAFRQSRLGIRWSRERTASGPSPTSR